MSADHLFRILNFGLCDLPFDLAQGGGELVEPFDIYDLLFEFFNFCNLTPSVSCNMLSENTN